MINSEWIHPEHKEVNEYLLNWGRWSRSTYPQGHCGSIEHRWKSPQCWYPVEPRPPETNEAKAILVERHMRILPRVSRRLLKFKYVYRADQEWIRQRLKVGVERYEQELYRARQIIKRLLFPEVCAHNNDNSEVPAKAESCSLEGALSS